MSSYQVWKDKANNRLHFIFRGMVSDEEVEDLSSKALLLAKKLRKGFTVNIMVDPDGCKPIGSLDGVKIVNRAQVNRIMEALEQRLS